VSDKRILLVEDNESDEKLAMLAFKRCGVPHEIIAVRDGAAALDYLFERGAYAGHPAGLPALVLLDLKLPKVDGLEVLRSLRGEARTRHLPVVVLTASKEDEDVLRSYALGANAYVRKPVEFAEFADAARTVSLFWLTLNQIAPAPRSAP
jgi:two-component system response regulator